MNKLLLLAFFFYLCCYLPIRCLVHNHSQRPSVIDVFLYTVVGLAVVSVFDLVLLSVGIAGDWWLLIIAFGSCWLLVRKPFLITISINSSCSYWQVICALLVFGCYAHLTLWQAGIMGSGLYPQYFFNVDTPYYLAHVHSLIKTVAYPPASLGNFGVSQQYHFGTQNMAALISRLTDIPGHTSLFWIVFPLMIAGLFAAIVRLFETVDRGLPLWILCAFILFLPIVPAGFWESFISLANKGDFATMLRDFRSPQLFSQGFPMFSTQMALLLSLVVITCVLDFDQKGNRALFLLSVVTLYMIKSPWFVGIGSGLALVSCYLLIRRDVSLFAYSLVALIMAGGIMMILPSPKQYFFKQEFGYFFLSLYDRSLVGNYPFNLDILALFEGFIQFLKQFALVLFVIIIAALVGFKRHQQQLRILLLLLLLILGPLLFVNSFVMIINDGSNPLSTKGNIVQVVDIIPYVCALLLFCLMQTLNRDRMRRKLTLLLMIIYLIGPLVHQALITYRFANDISNGHEFVDNRSIADALQYIPVEGSLIVTNDFRYPAQNYRRKSMQTQIPSLFGHQCYACNFKYELNPFREERKSQQQLLCQDIWSDNLNNLASSLGWTHFLVHKNYEHARVVPLRRVYENIDYIVYSFQ